MQLARDRASAGEARVATLQAIIEQHLADVGGIELEYVAFVRAGTVELVQHIEGPVVALMAARVGQTRLIDNLQIG